MASSLQWSLGVVSNHLGDETRLWVLPMMWLTVESELYAHTHTHAEKPQNAKPHRGQVFVTQISSSRLTLVKVCYDAAVVLTESPFVSFRRMGTSKLFKSSVPHMFLLFPGAPPLHVPFPPLPCLASWSHLCLLPKWS